MKDFAMPKVAMSDDEEMILSQWLVVEGEAFVEGQPLMEVETAKASMEIEAPFAGVLALQVRRPGDTVLAGDLVARLAEVGETFDPTVLEADRPPAQPTSVADQVPEQIPDVVDRSAPVRALPGTPPPGSPPEPGVEPTAEGRVLSPELAQFDAAGELYGVPARKRIARTAPGGSASSASARVPAAPIREPLSRHRRALARLMTQSATIPQFAVHRDLPMQPATRTVERLRADGLPVTVTDVVLRVTASALLQHPEINSHFVDGDVYRYDDPAIALAADSPGGVVAPVIRGAHRLSWAELARERRRVVEGARNGRLLPADMAGGTFAISNVGPLGGDAVVPMLTPPQVAILGLGRARSGWGETVASGVLVADHRVLDGADAARFLGTLAELFASVDVVHAAAGGSEHV